MEEEVAVEAAETALAADRRQRKEEAMQAAALC
jgi:hypothetical protein